MKKRLKNTLLSQCNQAAQPRIHPATKFIILGSVDLLSINDKRIQLDWDKSSRISKYDISPHDNIDSATNIIEHDKTTLKVFMDEIINGLQEMSKYRTAETYRSTLRSFMRFRKDQDIKLNCIDTDIISKYEAYLQNNGLTKNSSSFYLRILRAVYNRAVDRQLTSDRQPFKRVYTGIDKTTKRAFPLDVIKRIKNLDLSTHPTLEFARDIYLFSFYTRGMSFIDIAHLKKTNVTNGVLLYRRHKTGQKFRILWEGCMQEIIDKYNNPKSEYLLPIIKKTNCDTRTQYQNALVLTNRRLKLIGKILGINHPLTTYTARHSWANAARCKNIPLSVISEGMGHHSEKTTQIYLSTLDNSLIDTANSEILKSL